MQIKHSSIKTKILVVVLSAVFATAALISTVSLLHKVDQFNQETTRQTRATAFIFASTVADHLANKNRVAALRSLRAISRVPHFVKILVSDERNRSFAELGSAVILKNNEEGKGWFADHKTVTVPVINSGARIGHLTIVVKTDHLFSELVSDIALSFLATLLAGMTAVLLSFRMQAKIAGPIKALTDRMMKIRETQNFSQTVPNYSNDETGQLVDAFNDMQSNIRRRDQKLAKYMENLEQTIEERTYELVIAKEAAEQANEAKSDFLATMSHEIRTPMNGMLVMAELLASERLTDQNRRYADVIVKSGQSLLTIINDILDFSKIESGKLELETIEIDPSHIVDDVMNLFWERAASKNLELAAYIAPDVPLGVIGDPVRLNQVLSNLVNNALKFTSSGGVSLEILVRSGDPANTTAILEFAVIDTGIGIPPEKCATIFDAFSQADQSTTREFGGTGLGLAICQRLVGAMGGEISVTSETGEGSRFAFAFETKITKPALHRAVALPNRLETVLIGEGSRAADHIIARYMADFDLAVSLMPPSDITLSAIDETSLFIADAPTIEMVFDEQGIAEHRSSSYIVCFSSIGERGYEELVMQGLVDDVLTKPVSREEITKLLHRLDEGMPRGRSLLEQHHHEQTSFAQFTGAHILVADDSQINQEVVIEALKRLDITCETVSNGRLALEAVEERDYDAILMDCSMPEMDGFTATRKIRELEAQSNRNRHPIIALTAHVAGLPDHDWQSVGMDDYLTKPFRLQDLSDTLASYLSQQQSGHKKAGVKQMGLPADMGRGGEAGISGDEQALPIIDEEVINSYGDFQEDGGVELIARLLNLFLEHAPVALHEVEEIATQKDPQALAAAAHALKSMGRNIGASRLSEACNRLELAANINEEINLEAVLPLLKNELDLVNQRIKEVAIERRLPSFAYQNSQ